jgi:hypothetical protein
MGNLECHFSFLVALTQSGPEEAELLQRPHDVRTEMAALAEDDDFEAQGVEFGVGFLADGPEHLVGVCAHRGAAWRRRLLGQIDYVCGG